MGRISLALDVYHRTTADLLQNVTLPDTAGISSIIENGGTVRNRCIECQSSTTNIQTPTLTWRTDFTIASNQNRVVELHDGEPIPNGNFRLMEGHDMNTYWLPKWHGVDVQTGAPLWERAIRNDAGEVVDTEITGDYGEANNQIVGTATPNFRGGMRNTLQYRNFTLSAFLTFMEGATGYYGYGFSFCASLHNQFCHIRSSECYWCHPGSS